MNLRNDRTHSDLAKPLVDESLHPDCNLIVAIPVRDEADVIASSLEPFTRQGNQNGGRLASETFEVILLANNCRDNTVAIAHRFAAKHPALHLHVIDVYLDDDAHVGHARRMAMDEACARLLGARKPRGVIATTDGDTRVADTWVAATLAEIQAGADAVGGRITVDHDELTAAGSRRFRYHLQDVGYRSLVAELEALLDHTCHDPWPRHFQHFGASMALTAEMYEQVGGLPVQPYLEDVALYNRLFRADARIRHSPDVHVTTSAREQGRTTFGFAVQLAEWQAMDREHRPLLVEQAMAVERHVRCRRVARELMMRRNLELEVQQAGSLAAQIGVHSDWLTRKILEAETFGALWQDIECQQQTEGEWRRRWPLVDIRVAIRDLRYRLAMLRGELGGLTHLQYVEPVGRFAPANDAV